MKIQGMLASVATPFDHTGAIYRTKIQHNFEKWCRTSLAGFVVGSPAGEGPLLEAEEKIEVLRLAAPHIPDGRLMIADISAEGVWVAVKMAKLAAEAGAHAVVSAVPHQYRNMMYGPEAQALFFRALADQSPVPVLIHNAPQTAGVDLSAEIVAQLAEHPNIAGVIETGTPAGRVWEIRSLAPKDFVVLAGMESQLWNSLKAGANGAALAFASAAPYATIAVWEAFRTREEEAGIDWQGRISHPSILVTDLYGTAGLKHAMDLNGYYGGPPRLPFTPVSVEARAEIEDAFRDLKGVSNLLCPVRECHLALVREERRAICPKGHSFDMARSGYINLLQPQDRRSKLPGDTALAVAARRRLHDRGITEPLLRGIAEIAGVSSNDSVLDAGCGDGFYLGSLAQASGCSAHGVDISAPAVEAASKRYPGCEWIVANADRFVPWADASFSLIQSITARMNSKEFCRVMRDDGRLLVAVPAPDDLIELRGAGRDRVGRTVEEFSGEFRLVSQNRAAAMADLDASGVEDVLLSIYRPMHTGAITATRVTFSLDLLMFRKL